MKCKICGEEMTRPIREWYCPGEDRHDEIINGLRKNIHHATPSEIELICRLFSEAIVA